MVAIRQERKMILKQRAVTKADMKEVAEIVKRVIPRTKHEEEVIARFVSLFADN